MKDLVTARSLVGAVELIEHYDGVSADAIARSVGIGSEFLYNPDLKLSAAKVNDFFEKAAKVCEDRFFGLKLAEYQSFDVLEGDFNILAKHAPTIREVLTIFVNTLAQHCQALSVCLLPDNGGIFCCYEAKRILSDAQVIHGARVQSIELGIAIACREIKAVLGKDWRPSCVQFRHSSPQDDSPLKKVFGDNLFFNQDVNSFYLTTQECDRQWSIETQDSVLPSNTEGGQHQEKKKSDDSPFIQAVNQAVMKLLNSDDCTVQKVADELAMKLRTLQHRLSQANNSYQSIYDDIRLDLAKEYLCGSGLTVTDISERLNFTDPTAFSRFFKRRVGVSPAAFRKSIP